MDTKVDIYLNQIPTFVSLVSFVVIPAEIESTILFLLQRRSYKNVTS